MAGSGVAWAGIDFRPGSKYVAGVQDGCLPKNAWCGKNTIQISRCTRIVSEEGFHAIRYIVVRGTLCEPSNLLAARRFTNFCLLEVVLNLTGNLRPLP
jgi:hypothetical protein